jgi:hypothetical protein
MYLYELYKSVQTRAFGELFYPLSQREQINFIFNDNNVHGVYHSISKDPKQL